jgi:hypothetical protein
MACSIRGQRKKRAEGATGKIPEETDLHRLMFMMEEDL